MKGLFITGTDTGVGKTVASAALLHRYRALAPLRYWKPIQTGIEEHDDTETVRQLGGCMEQELFTQGIRLPKPVSPHLAARWAGVTIDLRELAALWPGPAVEASPAPQPNPAPRPNNPAAGIVEGAGGLLVPVNPSETMADWIGVLGLPVLVVARSGSRARPGSSACPGSSASRCRRVRRRT
jgi:dethiobiotin synthetase